MGFVLVSNSVNDICQLRFVPGYLILLCCICTL